MIARTKNSFNVDTDERGVATITLDVPDRPLNVLTQDAMQELEHIVSELEHVRDVRAVVIRSGKDSGFLAGADVNVIASIDSDDRADELIRAGQDLFARIEALSMPTIVCIHGMCLGGGLELSLACDYRIARNNSSTQIGLPEIKLGVIPGWGGTQRLPRKVGMTTALSMILQGELLDARQALKVGLIDRAIDPEKWNAGVDHFVDEVICGHAKRAKSRLPLWQRVADRTRLGRWFIARQVRAKIASKATNYPALKSALRAVELSYQPHGDGYHFEREEFVGLLRTPTCRNLLRLFFSRERARQIKTWSGNVSQAVHDDPIRRLGVVGAGAMGAGIGQLAAYRGFDVVMKEIDDETMSTGRARVEKLIDDIAQRKGMSALKKSELTHRVTYSCDDHALAEVDLVIEAVVERADVKAKVFESLDRVTKPSAILASNTSSLSVTEMSAATHRPQLVAGLHFFNPVHRMELVEVVRTSATDDASVARLVTFVRALGKTPVVTNDSSGFLVNRVLFPYLGEAIVMVGEGYAVERIDREIRRFGMPMGPLELLDQVGLDVAHHVAGSLHRILPSVAPVVDSLEAMVSRGSLGKKSGEGFYEYPKGRRGKPVSTPMAPVSPLPTPLVDDFRDDSLTPIQRRLVYPMLAESIRCLDEQVVEHPWAIDLAMVLGTGFAPHLGGPLRLVESITPAKVLANMRRLQFFYGERFEPPGRLVQMVDRGELTFDEPHFQPGVVR